MRLIKFILFGLLIFSSPRLVAEQGMPAIERAAKENKHLFIFFYNDQNERTMRHQNVFDQAMQKIGNEAIVVKVMTNDPSERAIVEKFDLSRSPMPIVLALAPNGAVTGFLACSFTEQQLIGSLVSPGMAKCLKALQDKKLAFVCLQNERTTGNEAALRGVKDFKADARFGNATEIIMINPSDTQEQEFLNQLAIDIHSTEATTVLIAPPAEMIGQYKGATSKDRLMSDLQNAFSGCCGAGGCGPSGCCPGGKCK
jgi:hypothetical protein